jgi:hypothetical protein
VGGAGTCVFIGSVEGHGPVGHLHVQPTDRLADVCSQSLLFLLRLHQVLQLIVRLRR